MNMPGIGRFDPPSAALLFLAFAIGVYGIWSSRQQPDHELDVVTGGNTGTLETVPDVPQPIVGEIHDYGESVNRPLLIPGRKPVPSTVLGPPSGSRPISDKSKVKSDLQLLGIVMQEPERLALIRAQQSGESGAFYEGETIGGWRIETIEADTVIVSAGQETSNLVLERKGDIRTKPRRSERRAVRKTRRTAKSSEPVDSPEPVSR